MAIEYSNFDANDPSTWMDLTSAELAELAPPSGVSETDFLSAISDIYPAGIAGGTDASPTYNVTPDYGGFWENLISDLTGAGVAGYAISQGSAVGTTTRIGTTTIRTGTAATSQTTTLLIIGVAAVALFFLLRK